MITTPNTQIPATTFKLPKEDGGVKPIIEQNNFTKQYLHTIGNQFDKIETKIKGLSHPKPIIKGKPLVNFRDTSSSATTLKTISTSKKINLMLKELKQEKTVNVLQHPNESQLETTSVD